MGWRGASAAALSPGVHDARGCRGRDAAGAARTAARNHARGWDQPARLRGHATHAAARDRLTPAVTRLVAAFRRLDLTGALPRAEHCSVHGLTVTRWKRYGHDRLYVSTADSERVGTSICRPERSDWSCRLWRRPSTQLWWSTSASPPRQALRRCGLCLARDVPKLAVACEDLVRRVPGQQALAEAHTRRRQAPIASAVGRLFGVQTADRSWRVGANGEQKVGVELEKLRLRDPRSRILHSVPVGERGADIDHVVVGPGGVFTLNAKHHRDKKVVVQGEAVYVVGFRQPYVRNSRYEARRASHLLSAAVGFPVLVLGVIVPVNAKDFIVKAHPKDVVVVNRRRVGQWLEGTYPVLPPRAIDVVFEAARRSTTWTARWCS